jgi:hypothetical protein
MTKIETIATILLIIGAVGGICLGIYLRKKSKRGRFIYCSIEIEGGEMCKDQCDYCKDYFSELEKEHQ